MRIRLTLLTLFLAASHSAIAADGFPAEQPPTVALAAFEEGILTLTERRQRFVEEKYTVKVPFLQVIDGIQVTAYRTESRTRLRPVHEQLSTKLKPGTFFLFDVAGQKIPEDDFGGLLKTRRAVLVSADGLPVAPSYRSLYRSDALVVVMKQLKPQQPPKPDETRPAPEPTAVRATIRSAVSKAAPPVPESR